MKKRRMSGIGKFIVLSSVGFVISTSYYLAPPSVKEKISTEFKKVASFMYDRDSYNRIACATAAVNSGTIYSSYRVTAEVLRDSMEKKGKDFSYMDERLKGFRITIETQEACMKSYATQVKCGKAFMSAFRSNEYKTGKPYNYTP